LDRKRCSGERVYPGCQKDPVHTRRQSRADLTGVFGESGKKGKGERVEGTEVIDSLTTTNILTFVLG
jgi:hypothetical protein